MGTDNLFWKKKKELEKRKSRNRGVLPIRFLIVCEGEKTEKYYFEAWHRKISSVKIRIEGCGKNTLSLVEKTLDFIIDARSDYEEYDQVGAFLI